MDNKLIQQNNQTAEVPEKKRRAVVEKRVFRVKSGYDRPMLVLIAVLLLIGAVMVYSASYAWADYKFDDSAYFMKKHLLWIAIGLCAMFVTMRTDYTFFRKLAAPFFAVTYILLLSVPFIGVTYNGAKRWISIFGIQVQPTEVMKLALVLFLALYISKFVLDYRDIDERTKLLKQLPVTKRRLSDNFALFVRECLIPIGIIGLVCGTTLLEHHLSGTIILAVIGICILYCGRVSWVFLLSCVAGGGGLAALYAVATGYTSDRITAWLDPYSDVQGSGWQIIQGLNAVGSGGLFGVGFCNSTQKYMYLPEPQNDYIFAIICEEFGYIGALGLLLVFAMFVWRGFVIAFKAPDSFSRLVAIGITCKIGIQVIFNIAVVTNLFPPTGISLPFISYGGTALLLLMVECGILLSISRFSVAEKK